MKSPHTSTSSLDRRHQQQPTTTQSSTHQRQRQQQQRYSQQYTTQQPPQPQQQHLYHNPSQSFSDNSTDSFPYSGVRATKVSFLVEDDGYESNNSNQQHLWDDDNSYDNRHSHHSSTNNNNNNMVWKRKQQQQSPRNRTPTRRRNPLNHSNTSTSTTSSQESALTNAPLHSKTPNSPPLGGYPYAATQQEATTTTNASSSFWESFDAATFATRSNNNHSNSSVDGVLFANNNGQQQHPRSKQPQTPNTTATSSTVTDSTTPSSSTTFGMDELFPPNNNNNNLSLLTPFVSERQDPQQLAQSFKDEFDSDDNDNNEQEEHDVLSMSQPSQQPSQQSSSVASFSAADIAHLLQPPTPEDRSVRKRLQYEKEKRRSVYDGELEPEGIRGQEAPLWGDHEEDSNNNNTGLPNLRTFEKNNNATNPRPRRVGGIQQQRQPQPQAPPGTPNSHHSSQNNNSNKHVTLLLTPTTPAAQTRAVTPDDLEASLLFTSPANAPQQQQQRQRPISPARSKATMGVRTVQYNAATGTTQPLPHQQSQSHQQQQQHLPNHMPRPILRNSQQQMHHRQPDPPPTTPAAASLIDQHSTNSTSTTDSDEELREMRSDLIQGVDERDTEQRASPQQQQQQPPPLQEEQQQQRPPQEAPSPAAAAAAAAAAESLQRSRTTNQQAQPNHAWPQVEPVDDALALSNSDLQQQPQAQQPVLDVDEWNRLAMQDVEEGRFDPAIARFTRVLEWQIEQHGLLHPAVASAHHNLGTVHAKRASSLPDESPAQTEAQTAALQAFQAAARTARDSLSPQHPNVAVSLVRIGFLLLQSKQYDNAVVTFQEALRIRILAYGAKHSLVANLYNNLGVCQMHLQQFGDGKEALEHALEIQRELLLLSSDDAASTHSVASKRSQSLEVADTLFNIGGLCLEWIRKRGPDLRRQQDAESAFEEALQIRTEILGPEDPLTVQVRDLLQMTRSIPRPRPLSKDEPADPHEYEMEAVMPEEVLSVSTPPTTPNSRGTDRSNKSGGMAKSRQRPTTPPDFADSPDRYTVPTASGNNNNGDHVGRVISPRRSKLKPTSPSQDSRLSAERPLSPGQSRASMQSTGTKSNQSSISGRKTDDFATPPDTPQHLPSLQQHSVLSPERQRLNNAKASIRRSTSGGLAAGKLSPRNGLRTEDNNNDKEEDEDEDERFLRLAASSSPTRSKNNDRRFGEFRDLDGNRLSNMYGGGSKSELPQQQQQQHRTKPIESERSRRNRSEGVPPVNEVTVRSAGDDIVEISTRGTRVFVQPSLVPVSPARQDTRNSTNEAVVVHHEDAIAHGAPDIPHASQYPFDPEENCLIGDTGIDSEYGRVHIPGHWAKAGLVLDEDDPEQRQREIMVTRPSRIDASKSPERRASSRSRSRSRSRGRSKSNERRMTAASAAATEGEDEIDYNTGNKERDDIMRRARAFIRAFESGSIDAVSTHQAEQPSIETDSSESFEESIEDSLQAEDGLAELGGDWFSSPPRRRDLTIEEMTRNPHDYLPEIYDEACSKLKSDDVAGALPLFEIIFRCQEDRYGAVHEHSASALYNLGIAHLRGQNADEALEAFEEATRIRRGALGREHPSVAVSLVKVGITLLLLHRFEDALWNFREALYVRKRALGSLHPSTARIYNNIGCVHVEFNELREARRAFETALDVQRNALSDDPDSRGIMLATATTLCNLGYLYRHRDLHGKAALVLKEAADLQETVLGRSNPAVLSTLDCLADSSASGGQTSDALRYYNIIITRYRVGGAPGSQTVLRAEAVLLYKMSRVHRQRNDRESQLDTLKLALRSVRALAEPGSTRKDALERRIVYDMRACREQIEKNKMKWI